MKSQLFAVVFLLYFLEPTAGWSCKLQHEAPLNWKILGYNIISCQSKCLTPHCSPRIKTLYESTPSIVEMAGRYAFCKKAGVVLTICFKSEILHEKLVHQWKTNVFVSSLTKTGMVQVVSKITDYSTPSLNPVINVKYDSIKAYVTIKCSIQYPSNQNQVMTLLRVPPNGEKSPITISPEQITGSMVNETEYVVISFTHRFLYTPDHLNNKFECVAVDQSTQMTKTASSNSFNFEREMDSNLMIKWQDRSKSLLNKDTLFAYDDFMSGIVLSCHEEIGVPRPNIHWIDSTGRVTQSDKILVHFVGPKRLCCHANQRLSHKVTTGRKCINIKFKQFKDCHEIKGENPNAQNGIYTIHPYRGFNDTSMKVFCDMKTNNQEWIVIQRRLNGQVNFQKYWSEYKLGFGELDKEFWLGNDLINQLTNAGKMIIRFDLWDQYNNYAYAEYSKFVVANEQNKYRLSIGGYAGNASNSMVHYHNLNGRNFSTRDQDNDLASSSCSQSYGHSGWWFNSCTVSNLNGQYFKPGTSSGAGILWYYWHSNNYSLKQTEIKIKYVQRT